MKQRGDWVQGIGRNECLRCSGYGKVYLAIDKTVNHEVAIKKVEMAATDEQCENEDKRLKTSTYPSVNDYQDITMIEMEQ